jgi:O-antigen/teichoic acid export membrane protein
VLIALIVAGIFFFQKYNSSKYDITWKLPWIFLVIGTSLNFMIAPFSSFLEGLGKVKEIAKVRLVQQIISPIIYCGGLALGAKLFVSTFMVFTTVAVFVYMIYKLSLYKYLFEIWKQTIVEKLSYFNEIFPYQWRIALSWISGYFIFQLFNPVLFASEGAVTAGQMGITISALNSLLAMAYSWINTKVPTMSGYIALKDYDTLDSLFFKTLKQIIFVSVSVVLFFVLVIFSLQYYDVTIIGSHIGNRFLPILPLTIFSLALLLQVPINCWAVYLRCHKKEPLLIVSVVIGILNILSAFTLGKYFGLYGLICGFLFIQLTFGLVWIYLIFRKKRNEWHELTIQ